MVILRHLNIKNIWHIWRYSIVEFKNIVIARRHSTVIERYVTQKGKSGIIKISQAQSRQESCQAIQAICNV